MLNENDPYQWLDPWERMEALKRQAAQSYDRGRDDVLTLIGQDTAPEFQKQLHHAVASGAQCLAAKIVDQHLLPNMAMILTDIRRKELELTAELLRFIEPVVHHAAAHAEIRLDTHSRPDARPGARPDNVIVHIYIPPLHYTQHMSPETRRR